MQKHRTCVIRTVKGVDSYIPIEDAVELHDGESVFIGSFIDDIVKDGPSGSHARTVCTPMGRLEQTQLTYCVIREVKPGDYQFVPKSDVPFVEAGERVVYGVFNCQTERCGPYGSHNRKVCLPAGYTRETLAEAA